MVTFIMIMINFALACALLAWVGGHFRRQGCWTILAITAASIPMGLALDTITNGGIGAPSQGLSLNAEKVALPYVVIAQFLPLSGSNAILWFWVIALQFMIYGAGACIACNSKKPRRNLAIYVAVAATIHVLAWQYANHLAPGVGNEGFSSMLF